MNTLKPYFLLLALLCFSACSRFLSEKSDSGLATPETLEDNQAMLDRYQILSSNATSGEISADDIYVTDADFNTMFHEAEKRLYTWQPDKVAIASGNDWENAFLKINILNTVLFNIDHYSIAGAENVKGQALALRGLYYLEAAQLWCLQYDPATAGTTLGLPLRLSPDMNIPSVRASLKDTYARIITDLQTAAALLPAKQIAVSRPSRTTALGLLSRAYLYMGDYENALKNGNAALALHQQLLNYNSLNPEASFPIPDLNTEILLRTSMASSAFLTSAKAKIHPEVYAMYQPDDLRRKIYFRILPSGEVLFKGNYSGSSSRMTVVATDELYLNVAEALAKTNQVSAAMEMLNKLLVNRWKSGTFTPFTASDQKAAVEIIRRERRKELMFRGLRWADIKRYNREGTGIILKRTVNGVEHILPANDLRYAIAIPEDIIKMTGMPQNPR